jgi:hypothetical protein
VKGKGQDAWFCYGVILRVIELAAFEAGALPNSRFSLEPHAFGDRAPHIDAGQLLGCIDLIA